MLTNQFQIWRRRMAVLAVAVCVCGCYMNKNLAVNRLNKLQEGMSREEIVSIVGAPVASEAYLVNDRSTEYMLYRIDYQYPNETFTTVALEEGRFVGWGEPYDRQRIKAAREAESLME